VQVPQALNLAWLNGHRARLPQRDIAASLARGDEGSQRLLSLGYEQALRRLTGPNPSHFTRGMQRKG
jgi:hypothetical protein